MDKKQMQADFYYCETIIKKHSKSFYFAFSKLPSEKAKAVYAIYAFCRIADDCADGNHTPMEKILALKQLTKELDLFRDYEEKDKPLWRALRQVFNTYEMDIQPFYDQLTGQSMDINFAIPETLQVLEKYSYYVAGSVGLMLLPVIASKSPADLRSAAIDLGTAMQITNILRDVGEDFHEKNRIYLPKDELSHFQYTQDDLRNGLITMNFINLWEKLAVRAESLYNNFMLSIDQFDADSRKPVYLSAKVYRGILDVVRSNDYKCLSKRNYMTKEKMKQINAAFSNYS
ncbi:phytoene/squalene synthase family protein [Peribacillus cavernae]|uniref:Phytoene/squalene synthase family protein n=1 Tax=Peribacillus cavernae TaxID=1674310 RepID=A0A3S0V948_9BACI|nr:phytoene/squalene synthase family protein [Peribacillus cavernae]MDQ0220597.1 phytoene synthase [Peribacillus cavernae]RUQ27344.1 phytoene/squalene synthase family protein [Peribacillus cavernae]